MVANRTGINVTSLTDGTYKLVIEPVIYLIYNHLYYAMTTTEAGLYNRMLGGDLGAHFPTVVMKNLALALFLENAVTRVRRSRMWCMMQNTGLIRM